MDSLFESLTHTVQGGAGWAIGAAFVWGVLSVVLSPCHLASIPLIVGVVDAQRPSTTGRAFLVSSLFALGILASIAAVGAATAAAGRVLGDLGPFGYYGVAVVLLAIGLHLMDVMPLPLPNAATVTAKRKGPLAAAILGLVFGLALGPCTFAYVAPVLSVAFNAAGTRFFYAVALTLAFGAGHCAVIVAAGTSTGAVQRYLDWNERSRGALWLKRVCGGLVVLGGLYLIYVAPA